MERGAPTANKPAPDDEDIIEIGDCLKDLPLSLAILTRELRLRESPRDALLSSQ
jgi:hypothetical protein